MTRSIRIMALAAAWSVFAHGCAPKMPADIKIPPQRIVQRGYSLLPLNEAGWKIGGRNESNLGLVRGGANQDESYVIATSVRAAGPFQSPDDFAEKIKAREIAGSGSRHVIKEITATPHDGKGATCATMYVLSVDTGAQRKSGNTGDMMMESFVLECAHPDDRTISVVVMYSHRYYPGHRDEQFMQKAQAVVAGVKLTALKP